MGKTAVTFPEEVIISWDDPGDGDKFLVVQSHDDEPVPVGNVEDGQTVAVYKLMSYLKVRNRVELL